MGWSLGWLRIVSRLVVRRIRSAWRFAPATTPTISHRWAIVLFDNNGAAPSALGPGLATLFCVAFSASAVAMVELRGVGRKAIPRLQRRMRLLHSIFRPWHLVSVAFADEASTPAVVTFRLSFIALLLAPPARPTASLRPVCELPLSLLWVHLHTSTGHFGSVWVLEIVRFFNAV